MTLKDKAKTYNFWISLVSAAVLIVRIIGNKFNIFIDTTLIMDITTGLCSIFVILGILSAPKSINTNQIHTTENDTSSNTTNNLKLNMTETKIESNNSEEMCQSKKDTLNDACFQLSAEAETIQTNESVNDYIQTEEETSKPIEQTKPNIPEQNVQVNNGVTLIEIIEKLKSDISQANIIIKNISSENK